MNATMSISKGGGEAQGFGVLGGMGPLVSNQFLDTLQQFCRGRPEQEVPVVLLYSDSRMPDRTATFLSGDQEAMARMLERLTADLRLLCQPGIGQLVVCCITIHHLFDRLPEDLRARTRNLVSEVLEAVARRRRPHLMVCTTGTCRLQVFQRHPAWPRAAEWIVWPSEADQERVHDAIYELKVSHDASALVALLRDLCADYGIRSLIAGCTEIHLTAKHFASLAPPGQDDAIELLDPLTLVAQAWMAAKQPGVDVG